MAVSRIKTWVAGEVLNASDLNAEFDNQNQTNTAFPLTNNVSAAGYTISNAVLATTKQLNDNVVCMDNYADFATAISSIGSTQTTLLINTNVNVTASATVPSTLTLWFLGQGKLTISASQVVTINGPLIAPPMQIFAGSGTVAGFGKVPTLYADWWGTNTTPGTTDMTVAIQAAIDAAVHGTTVTLLPTIYLFSTLSTDKSITLVGSGAIARLNAAFGNASWADNTAPHGQVGTVLRSTATSGAAINLTSTAYTWQFGLERLALIGPGSGTSTGVLVGTASYPVAPATFRDVAICNFSVGLDLVNTYELNAINVRLVGNTSNLKIATLSSDTTFYRCEFQSGSYGANLTKCSNIAFHGCLFQNNTVAGVLVAPAVAGGIDNIAIRDSWFENNATGGTGITLDLTSGSGRLLTVDGCKLGDDSVTFSGANTWNKFTILNTNALGVTATIPATVSNFVSLNTEFAALTDSSTRDGVTNAQQSLVAPMTAKAWCRFDGTTTGTNAPTSGFNVTSVTRNSTGDYTITFTNAIPANGAVVAIGRGTGYGNGPFIDLVSCGTTSANIRTLTVDTIAVFDTGIISVVVFA